MTACLVACCAMPAVASTTPAAVTGHTFSATAPADWHVKKVGPRQRVWQWYLTSAGKASDDSVPVKGAIAVTIWEMPLSYLGIKHPGSAKLVELLDAAVGVPSAASDVGHTEISQVRVAGATAVDVEFQYRYRGRRIVQVDTVTRRNGYLIGIEVDVDRANADTAGLSVEAVLSTWRWRS